MTYDHSLQRVCQFLEVGVQRISISDENANIATRGALNLPAPAWQVYLPSQGRATFEA